MIRTFIRTTLLVALAHPLLFAVTKNKAFQESNFSKGLDSYHNPQTLDPGFVQDSNNVLFDDKAPVSKRAGYTLSWTTKSYSYTGLWTYTDKSNTTWQLARSSDQITASDLKGNIVKVATVSVSNTIGETNAFGSAYFVDQTQGVYYWNGTSTTYVSGSPLGSIITTFHNRLWVTGAAVPNGNLLYGSEYYNGANWTTGLNATDPVQFSVGLQDNFDNVTAAYVYIDTLYLFKHYSISALYGFDQTNFQISQLTQECGCIDGNSIRTYNGGLKFVSLRGVEDFNGYSCKRISDAVKNKVDPAIQIGSFSQQSWVQSSQADWSAGTLNQTSAAISPPYLVISTGVKSLSLSSDFSGGTTSNTYILGNTVVMSTDNVNFPNYSFESALTINDWANSNNGQRVCVSQVGDHCTIVPRTGSCDLYYEYTGSNFTMRVRAFDYDSNLLSTLDIPWASNSCGYTSHTLSMSGQSRKAIVLLFDDITNGVRIAGTPYYLANGTDITFYTASDSFGGGPTRRIVIDDVTNGRSDIDTGWYQTPTYDTGFSQSLMNIATSYNQISPASDSNFTATYQTSSNGSSWSSNTSIGNNQTVNRYVRYVSTWSRSDINGSNLYAQLSNVTYTFTASSGSFKSQIHNVGSINSWGNFSVQEVLNSGTIDFSICGSTNSNMSSPVSCASQPINSQITISTKTYVQWYATFTVTAATQTPTLKSGTVQWFSGSAQIPMSATVWDNRYWLSLTTNTADSANDAVLVLDKTGAWSIFDIHAGAFTQYKNSLYHADSLASGNVYLDNQGYSDNGSAINAFIKTRTMPLATFAEDDYLYALYPSAVNTGACAMNISYRMDGDGSSYSLGSPLLSEYAFLSSVRLPFPVDASHQTFGQSIDFTIGTNDASCDWQFYGLNGLMKPRPIQ